MGYKYRVSKSWLEVAVFSILMAVILAVALNAKAHGMNRQQSSAGQKSSAQTCDNSSSDEPTKNGRESGGDSNAKFKYSSSVKWTARKLGVSTATAYGLSVALNFITIVAAVALFLRSKLSVLFRNRTQVIRQSLDEARKASEEAKNRLSAIEAQLAKLQSDIAAIQSIAEQESRAEDERILAAAEEEKRKIVEAAEQEITAAVNLANHDFRAYAAELAVTLAANGIQVDTSTDERLLRSFIGNLGRGGSN
jgi:F-type H+-transporting ATPase subunit b